MRWVRRVFEMEVVSMAMMCRGKAVELSANRIVPDCGHALGPVTVLAIV